MAEAPECPGCSYHGPEGHGGCIEPGCRHYPAAAARRARALLTDALAVLDSVARQDPDVPLPHEVRAEVEGLCARIEREREGWT